MGQERRPGGIAGFDFQSSVVLFEVTVIDMEDYSASFVRPYGETGVLHESGLRNYGNNSVQTVDFSSFADVTRLEVHFGGSGAIDDLVFT